MKPSSAGVLLSANHLSKRFGRRRVFHEVGFEAQHGEVLAVVGRNGAGKSTLLQIVAGLVRPSSGEMIWKEDVANQCGLSAPDAPVYRELSVLENLEFFAHARRGDQEYSGVELLSHLANFELDRRAHDLAGELSSGLRARLQLAVATLNAPPVLLLDEPSANLDEAGRAILESTLHEQRGRGLALLATNDARDLELCDGVIELS